MSFSCILITFLYHLFPPLHSGINQSYATVLPHNYSTGVVTDTS